MAPITLYYSPLSPVSRSVIFLANYLKIDVELKKLDFAAKEHLQESYLKINPQHTVPTLVDNGFVLTESRAILAYLVNSKAAESSLYSKCAKKRATIDSRLYFDATTLNVRMGNVGVSMTGIFFSNGFLTKIKFIFRSCAERCHV